MASPIPKRDRNVFFVGAGLSSALGLPNTAELLDVVFDLAESNVHWGQSEKLASRLRESFKFFYPDGAIEGFRPNTVDFFSALGAYVDVSAGLPGTGFKDGPELFRALKFAIAHVLVERLRLADSRLEAGEHCYLNRMVQPGNIVITSNWDVAIERYAQHRGVPVRHSGRSQRELVVLKLHGSIDWCRRGDCARTPDRSEFCALNERYLAERTYAIDLPTDDDSVVRIRSLERWGDIWRKIKSRADDLHMVTMVRGKSGDLGPLREVWRDAYQALSAAQTLEIVGYSMPEEDTEIRTLIRTGVRRGATPAEVVVLNPSPDVHDRFRSFIDRRIRSIYQPINSV